MLLLIFTSEKTLKFDNIRVNKKEFHKSKQSINLHLVNTDQIVVSDEFKHNDDGFKYFIGYNNFIITYYYFFYSHQNAFLSHIYRNRLFRPLTHKF